MKKRITAFILVALSLFSFSGCNSLFTTKGEEATIKSDADSDNIKEVYDKIEEQLSVSENSKSVATSEAFSKVLTNQETSAAAYNGTENIIIKHDAPIEKTVTIKTVGSVTISSAVSTVVLERASDGFNAEAKTENIIINGTDITADINAEVDCIYIIGKNAVLNINDPSVSKIIARNSTAIINNHTDTDVFVTLTNGTKVTVPSKHYYEVQNNLIYKL
ncbi:MAG: hypothetical protein IJO68_01570 [Clostridia bacterium]|nr:hypothetical protein [Clostridia bacterium]MBQ9945198.1 hypothetical protein [Clostridia bacterium]